MIYYKGMDEPNFWDDLFNSTRKLELAIEEPEDEDSDVDEVEEDDYADDLAV